MSVDIDVLTRVMDDAARQDTTKYDQSLLEAMAADDNVSMLVELTVRSIIVAPTQHRIKSIFLAAFVCMFQAGADYERRLNQPHRGIIQ